MALGGVLLLHAGGCALPTAGAREPTRQVTDPLAAPTPGAETGAEAEAGTETETEAEFASAGEPAAAQHPPEAPAPSAIDATAVAPPAQPAAGPALDPDDARGCYDRLWRSGVTFELVKPTKASGIGMPIRLTSPIGGVEIAARDGNELHAIIDCRLALQLYAWTPALRAAGIVALEHYSVYRPGARTSAGRRSGHASGLAIDLASYRMQDGRSIDVLTDWEERDRGEDPCPRRPHEAWGSRVLRGTVCDAIERSLFHVVLTPHHDKAHQNHVHLELKPSKDWTYVR